MDNARNYRPGAKSASASRNSMVPYQDDSARVRPVAFTPVWARRFDRTGPIVAVKVYQARAEGRF